ncbi:MAG TPA: HDOD domain-containing protein [Candidatus Saccharimonadales bacterium]|nr:HDOD domain-containing protein [Candidatus Saccharimonadales bacterium]
MVTETSHRDTLLERVTGLPPFPQVLMRVWQVIDNPATDAARLAEAVSADPSLVATLLKLANSAAYGRLRAVGTVQEAILVLGFKAIKQLCVASIVKVGLLIRGQGQGGFDRVAHWRHCMGAALTADVLDRLGGLGLGDQAFSYGLLHDVGLLAVERCMPQGLAQACQRQAAGGTLLEAEREVLGVDHLEAGGELARAWNFPPALERTIVHHARPRCMAGHEMEALVHVSCALTDPAGFCRTEDTAETLEETRRFLRLSSEQLDDAQRQVGSRLTQLAGVLEL